MFYRFVNRFCRQTSQRKKSDNFFEHLTGFDQFLMCWHLAVTRSISVQTELIVFIKQQPTGCFSIALLIDICLRDGYLYEFFVHIYYKGFDFSSEDSMKISLC